MPLTRWGEMDFATDRSMAVITNTSDSEFRGALIGLLEVVAADVIANDPTIRDAVMAAIEEGLNAAEVKPLKCVHLEGGKWVYDGPDGLAATHYVLPDDTGALIVRPTVWPVPQSTPAFNW
ncbi:hypothetical protein PFZ55_39885 [Streptomyces sp. MS2A]|nr:hypothetical protein [Streptomyces sp. MS2A]